MSRIVPFPLVTDLPRESEADAAPPEPHRESEAGLDPSTWGVPRAFFIVHAPVKEFTEAKAAG